MYELGQSLTVGHVKADGSNEQEVAHEGQTGKVIEVYGPDDHPFIVRLEFPDGQTGAFQTSEVYSEDSETFRPGDYVKIHYITDVETFESATQRVNYLALVDRVGKVIEVTDDVCGVRVEVDSDSFSLWPDELVKASPEDTRRETLRQTLRTYFPAGSRVWVKQVRITPSHTRYFIALAIIPEEGASPAILSDQTPTIVAYLRACGDTRFRFDTKSGQCRVSWLTGQDLVSALASKLYGQPLALHVCYP